MRELQQELSRCMARAGLQSAPSLMGPSRGRRHSQGHSASWTHSPSTKPLAREAAKWLIEYSPTGWYGSWKQQSQLRGRSRSGGAKVPQQNTKGKPYHHPLVPQDLVFQESNYVSICEPWNYRPGPRCPGVGHTKAEHLVQLKRNPQSRSDLMSMKSWAVNLHCPQAWLSSWLGGETAEWYTTLTPTTIGPIDTLWPNHEKAPQQSSNPTGRARPKIPAWPSIAQSQSRPEEPDPVSHPHRWVHVEMLKISHIPWWKTLMPSGKMAMFSCILHESHNEPEAPCLAHWEAMIFHLPLAQQEAAWWWAPPLTIPGLHLRDYMPSLHFLWLLDNEAVEGHGLT